MSFVQVTYELIASSFKDTSNSAWVLAGYNLGHCIALPIVSKAHFKVENRGLGGHLWQVIAGRIITGLGGSGMLALVSVIITENVPPNQVALMRSYVNVVNVIGRAFGGPLGAVITDALGWRWSFICQVPIALTCCAFCVIILSTDTKSADSPARQIKERKSVKDIDYLGIGAFSISITSLLASIQLFGKQGSNSKTALVLLGVAVFFGLLVLLIEAFYTKEPLIPLGLLRTVTGIYFLAQMILVLGREAHVSTIAPYFLWTEDLKSTAAALRLIPSPIGFTIGSLLSGYIIQRTSKYKSLCMASLVFTSMVYLVIALRWGYQPYRWENFYILPAGMGMGAILTCTFVGMTMSTPKSMHATAICIYFLCQQVGGIIGTAAASVTLRTILNKTLQDWLNGIPRKEDVIREILNGSGSLSVPETLRKVVHFAYRHSFQFVAIIPSLATALVLPLLYLTPEVKID
ncbi:hypothetical protein HYFRA_00003559 [Hymenoscyphus fraxineus]|uniref:Major facilitator superfamily (MFS) profile domain-containing protein n=1 Tax=Hymenoscyphus fraxineus TaxID=746836 RepID=A0A9N9PSF5_9HELO|nr:hypothetical protein HYFRA_00003559 [Hymenoscyphus fraxineus]